MRDDLSGTPRLNELMGGTAHGLPPHLAARLECMLLALQTVSQAPTADAATALPRSGTREAAAWMKAAGTADQWCAARLQGLAAVLELLHAVHLEGHDSADERMLGDHLVEGLLVAGRLLAGHADPPGPQGVPR